jgi:hypothetical protein
MRRIVVVTFGITALLGATIQACSSASSGGGFAMPEGGSTSSGGSSGSTTSSGGTTSSSGGGTSSGLVGDGGLAETSNGDGGVIVKNTVYAHTDTTLYSIDPSTKAATMIGPMVGTSDSSTDSAVTDLAVNSAGDVYVNSESKVYQATLPAGGAAGTVTLTPVATIQGTSSSTWTPSRTRRAWPPSARARPAAAAASAARTTWPA